MRQQCSACAIGIDNVRALHVASFAVAEGHLALLPPTIFGDGNWWQASDTLISVTYPTVKPPMFMYIFGRLHMGTISRCGSTHANSGLCLCI